MLNEPVAEAHSHSARRSSNAAATTTGAMSTSFSSAVFSGQTQLGTPLTFNLNPVNASGQPMMPPLVSAESSAVTAATPNVPSSSSPASLAQQATTFNSLVNKTSSASTNLRDRIAKLIKDIVVHHGDNIQYVQLADQLNHSQSPALSPTAASAAPAPAPADMNGESVSLSSTNSILSVCLSPEVSVDLTTSAEIQTDPPSTADSIDVAATATARQCSETPSSSSTVAAATSSSQLTKPNGATTEDDVPLIQA